MENHKRRSTNDAGILAALPAFAAAARLGSFTRAARELGLTQSGLSRRIAALELELGVPLFSRRGRSISITDDGIRLAETAAEAIRMIERTRLSLGGVVSGSIRVGVLPSIGGLWLAPRLPRFLATQPATTVGVVTIDADFASAHKDPVNWDPSLVDVVLTWGRGGWPMLTVNELSAERMMPVCSPAFAEAHSSDLWELPRLAHSSRSDAWRGYAQTTGYRYEDHRQTTRLEFEHFFMILEACRAGAGVALIPDMFVKADLAEGRLVGPWPAWNTGAAYAAVASPSAMARPAVSAFVEWVVLEGRRG